ncbi:hypothetical protein F5148DRAFT_727448 [Russula earlei]|uniref:Uncharacterized protein n=1 Tax=Russula earlei TaxID=71964 RepID=A0ACC0TTN2_9AGAM|nr:hypothetical protein F5148DRAFT_727448 [Russula earlei]
MNFHLGTRRSAVPSSASVAPAASSVKDDFPEALTYRYNDNSAWVPAARSHEEAIDLAKHAYPELRSVRRDRITFHTTGKSSIACITPAAWQLVVRRLPPYHVVDVKIRDMEGLEGDAELPEYPYMNLIPYAVPKDKEEQRHQQNERPQSGCGDGGSRLRRVLSFVRGPDT